VRRAVAGTVALTLAAVAVIAVQLSTGWLHPVIAAVARKDPTIEGIDWTSLRGELTARGLLHAGSVVAVPNWRDAGKVAYALGPEITVLCLNRDSRQFGFAHPAAGFIGQHMLVVAPEHSDRVIAELGDAFSAIERLPDAAITHRGDVLRQAGVFEAHHFRGLP
jgi:hypothetical protein